MSLSLYTHIYIYMHNYILLLLLLIMNIIITIAGLIELHPTTSGETNNTSLDEGPSGAIRRLRGVIITINIIIVTVIIQINMITIRPTITHTGIWL